MYRPTRNHIPSLSQGRLVHVQHILELCLYSQPAILPPSRSDPRHVLVQVCSSWRGFILATSSFWDKIIFHPQQRPFRNPERQISFFHIYVKRSGSNPLSLCFLTDLEQHDRRDAERFNLRVEHLVYGAWQFSAVQRIILPYIGRIKHLRCFIARGENTEFLLNIPPGSFRVLESVDITFLNDITTHRSYFTMEQYYNFQPFRSLPNLCMARIRILNGIHPLDLQLPWGQMTKLDFGNMAISPEVFIRIMRRAGRCLVDAFFHVEFDIRSTRLKLMGSWNSIIVMLTLSKFRLRLVNPSFHSDLILLLRMPVLQELWVEKAESDPDLHLKWDIPRYTTLLSHSTNSLARLLLSNFRVEPRIASANISIQPPSETTSARRDGTSYHELDVLFKTTPNLVGLCLPRTIHVHIPTMEKIAKGHLLPRLQTLELCTIDAEYILRVVNARNHVGSGSNSAPPAPIMFIELTIPSNDPGTQRSLEEKARALQLTQGCRLLFIAS